MAYRGMHFVVVQFSEPAYLIIEIETQCQLSESRYYNMWKITCQFFFVANLSPVVLSHGRYSSWVVESRCGGSRCARGSLLGGLIGMGPHHTPGVCSAGANYGGTAGSGNGTVTYHVRAGSARAHVKNLWC